MTHAFPSCVYAIRQRLVIDVVAALVDAVPGGQMAIDRPTAQALVAVLGAAQETLEVHRIDGRGRCAICWRGPTRWWRAPHRRSVCTVYETFGAHLGRSARL